MLRKAVKKGKDCVVMNVKEVPVDSLRIPEYCRRQHSQDQIERFIKSFQSHGQYQPIVVSGDEILCGTLIFLALKQLKKEKCFINDLGAMPLEKKKEIRYLDNQIFDIEDWESEALKKFLMSTSVDELEKFGFSPEETELFINQEAETPLLASAPISWKTQWTCEACGWTGALETEK